VPRVPSFWGLAMTGIMLLSGVGCGGNGGEPLPATEYRDRANAICRDLSRTNTRAFERVDVEDRSAVARATEEIGRRTEQALDDLGVLEGPEASEAGVDRFLARAQELRAANMRRADAVSSGDADAAERAEQDATRLTAEVENAARDAGLDACAAAD